MNSIPDPTPEGSSPEPTKEPFVYPTIGTETVMEKSGQPVEQKTTERRAGQDGANQ